MYPCLTFFRINFEKLGCSVREYKKTNNVNLNSRVGVYAVTEAKGYNPKGVIMVLKNISMRANIKTPNRLHPFYLVYISEQGKIVYNYLKPKEILSVI